MAAGSLDSSFSLGIQSAKGTAATAYKTALATVSGVDVQFDERGARLEHPGATARATALKSPIQRTGYLAPVNATFLLYPRLIGVALRGIGFACSTVNNTTHFTHTFTLATSALSAWVTALHKYVGTTDYERKVTDVRLTELNINSTTEEIECSLAGMGLGEGNATGSETKVAEIDTELSPYSGFLTFEVGGVGIASPIRGTTLTIAHELDQDDKVLFSTARNDLRRKNIGITGTLTGIDIDYGTYDVYKKLVRGGAGTAPSLAAVTGLMDYTFQSLSNIPGAAVPYSLSVSIAAAQYKMTAPNAQNDDIIRTDVEYSMIDNVATPVTIILTNDQAAYA